MWIQSLNPTNSCQSSPSTGQFVEYHLNAGSSTKIFRFYHQQQLQKFETAEAVLLLQGRIRRYGEDYAAFPDYNWVLQLLLAKPANYYQQLAGFFSLVVLDNRDGSVLLLNDHVASIPLYYHLGSGHQPHAEPVVLWVSDNLKHQAASSLALNPQAIFNYFFFHCIPSGDTIFQQVNKLPPASELQHSVNGTEQHELYIPAYSATKVEETALQQQCREAIGTAVKRNITPNNAAFLSGGLDSSTVSGYLCKNQPGARTFSIGFDATGYDETEYALITAKHFGSNHHVHYLQPTEIVDNFVDVAGYFDEPFGNSSAMAAFICARVAKSHGADTMLAGDGGDEIFAGNERYAKQKVFEVYQQVPGFIRSPLELLLKTPLAKLPVVNKAKSYVEQANVPLPDRLDSYNFLNRFALDQMFCAEFLARVDVRAPAAAKRARYHACKSEHPVERMMYLDWKFTLADNDFVKVTSMCHKAGVEVRYPLFEKEVVDFSCTVPTELKLPGNKLRDFYKNSFRGFLPDATLAKSKHGFGLPFGVWMKEQPALQQLTRQSLNQLKTRNIIKAEFIDEALQIYQSGHSGYYGELIWIMLILELWLQQTQSKPDAA
ncbi:asparagine synthetase B family protein [Rheinheimera sp.]|uniref:asparagine synthetase B family protein n=1 Tax=Rheinheimera sp. TaxID=1869214 RepID=UPI002FDE2D4A